MGLNKPLKHLDKNAWWVLEAISVWKQQRHSISVLHSTSIVESTYLAYTRTGVIHVWEIDTTVKLPMRMGWYDMGEYRRLWATEGPTEDCTYNSCWSTHNCDYRQHYIYSMSYISTSRPRPAVPSQTGIRDGMTVSIRLSTHLFTSEHIMQSVIMTSRLYVR